jgi:hypothetical protein
MQRKINDKRKRILSTIHMRHHIRGCRPQQQSTTMVSPSMGSTRQESRPPTGSRLQHHRKREKLPAHN